MVDDILRFKKKNYVSYKLLPEDVETFLNDDVIWDSKNWNKEKLKKLLEERKKVLKIVQNDQKGLEFLGQNKLYFLFQHNIVQSNEIKPYKRWFDFAERTRDENNTEADFESYTSDPIFADIIRIINRQKLTEDDLSYIATEAKYEEQMQRFVEVEQLKGRQEGIKEGIKEGRMQERIGLVQKMKQLGISIEMIAQTTGLTMAEIEKI